MSNNERAQVALFIDWDNLAISTAADLGGATPDVKAIVQRAQQYGTIIMAKAYAEWQATSDRLSVYRAGVEPVYAPTFRFEPDTANQPGKGKSLADPCMVADCVDTLHLFPDISVYVLVTGDKDMIPVVRLVQLRGRRVIVIGPDYVAGVLREMADEFISYRSLVEVAPVRPVPEPVRRYGAHAAGEEPARRRSVDRHAPAASFVRPERAAASAPATTPPTPPPAPTPAPTPARGKATAEVRPTPEVVEAPPEPAEERTPPEDLRAVFATIVDILQQRLDEKHERIRATNLKDALMQRLPGFSERKYGFAKFKDLLAAAEKSNLIVVTGDDGRSGALDLPARCPEAGAARRRGRCPCRRDPRCRRAPPPSDRGAAERDDPLHLRAARAQPMADLHLRSDQPDQSLQQVDDPGRGGDPRAGHAELLGSARRAARRQGAARG